MPTQSGCTLCGGNDHERSSCSWSGATDERQAFRAAHQELDLTEKADAWGRDQFLHSHVEATWRGWQAGASWQRAQSAPNVPEGWPTDSMVVRGAEELHDCLRQSGIEHDFDAELRGTEQQQGIAEQIFLAMLAASPAPEVQQGEFGDAYQGAREDLSIWKRRALEAEEKLRQCDQGFTVLASLHTHCDGRQRVQLPGMVYDQDAGWGAHVEQLVSLSQARSAVFQAVVRCEQKGAFKACLECGYQDGHDAICKYHESHRAERQEPAPDADRLALDAATDIMALMYGPTPAGGSVQLKAQVQCRVLDAINSAPRPAAQHHSGGVTELVEALITAETYVQTAFSRAQAKQPRGRKLPPNHQISIDLAQVHAALLSARQGEGERT